MKANTGNVDAGCWILTFPFWIYVDQNTPPPERTIFKYKDKRIQINRPFRSGKANFINMPIPTPSVIPNASYSNDKYRKNKKLYSLATIPRLDKDQQGKYQITAQMDEKWSEKPNPFPMDSLRIDIEDSWGKPPDNSIIIDLSNKLLNWIRILSSQWWINRDISGLIGYNRCAIGINENGKFITYPSPTAKGRTVGGFEKPLTNTLWHTIIEKVKNNEDWQPHEASLLDAHYLLANNDLKGSIMNIALALETYTEYTYKRLWDDRTSGISFKKGRLMSNNLPSNLSDKLKKFIGKTYKNANNSKYSYIEELWYMRHQVAHGGNQLIKNKSEEEINENDVKRVIKGAKHCIDWLKSL